NARPAVGGEPRRTPCRDDRRTGGTAGIECKVPIAILWFAGSLSGAGRNQSRVPLGRGPGRSGRRPRGGARTWRRGGLVGAALGQPGASRNNSLPPSRVSASGPALPDHNVRTVLGQRGLSRHGLSLPMT